MCGKPVLQAHAGFMMESLASKFAIKILAAIVFCCQFLELTSKQNWRNETIKSHTINSFNSSFICLQFGM